MAHFSGLFPPTNAVTPYLPHSTGHWSCLLRASVFVSSLASRRTPGVLQCSPSRAHRGRQAPGQVPVGIASPDLTARWHVHLEPAPPSGSGDCGSLGPRAPAGATQGQSGSHLPRLGSLWDPSVWTFWCAVTQRKGFGKAACASPVRSDALLLQLL